MNERPSNHPETTDALEQERLAIGQAIVDRIRVEANESSGYFPGSDPEQERFRELYLTERHLAVPEVIAGDDVYGDVRSVFALVFNEVRSELDLRMGREESHWLYIDAAVDDSTTAILCTGQTVLALYSSKPWAFTWEDEETMARSLGEVYEGAAQRLLAERQRRTTYGTTRT